MHQLRIFVTDPSGTEHEHLHRSSPVLLGRLGTCEVQVADPRVSRIHVHLSWSDDTLSVRDMGSGNRTIAILEGGWEREVLRDQPLRVPTGEVELRLGETIVHVRLERVHTSSVPSAVVAAACTASNELRAARSRSGTAVTTPDGETRPSVHILESLRRSVLEVRRALQVDMPEEATTRWTRNVEDARSALLRWSHELMISLECATDALKNGSPLPSSPEEDAALPETRPPSSNPTETASTTVVTPRRALPVDAAAPVAATTGRA